MKLKSHVLPVTVGLLGYAAIVVAAPALSADRFEGGDRGVIRPPAETVVIFKEPTGSGIDTRGRSVTELDSHAQRPFVTQVYRGSLQSPPPYERRDPLTLSLRFGDASGFLFLEPASPWVRVPPRYYRARPNPYSPGHRQAPLILNAWPYTPWFQDAPRRHHARPHVRRHFEMTRFDRARPLAPRVRYQSRPARMARPAFRRWGQ